MPQQASRRASQIRQQSRQQSRRSGTGGYSNYLQRLGAQRRKPGATPAPSAHPDQGRRPRRPPKPKTHVVKRDETYASLAEKYNQPQEELIQAAGVNNLTAGAVINLPEAAVTVGHPDHPQTPVAPKPQHPDHTVIRHPDHGPATTAVEQTKAGTDFGAPGVPTGGFKPQIPTEEEIRTKQYQDFRAMEIQGVNDEAHLVEYQKLFSGEILPLGPTAVRIRREHEEYLKRQAEQEAANAQPGVEPPPVGKEIVDAVTLGVNRFNNWWEFQAQGGEAPYDPETGEWGQREYKTYDEKQADLLRAENQQRRTEMMQEYYQSMIDVIGPEGVEAAQTNVKPQEGEPYSQDNYNDYAGDYTYSDGEFVYFARDGKVIPYDEFPEYLEANDRDYESLEDYMDSPEGQTRIFRENRKTLFTQITYALTRDDRSFLPPTITPAQLEAQQRSGVDWDDYMRNVLNYRWDAEAGHWVKQEEDTSLPVGGVGEGYGGGYGGGYASGGDFVPGSGQYQRGGTGKDVRSDSRFSKNVSGLAPIHWRI